LNLVPPPTGSIVFALFARTINGTHISEESIIVIYTFPYEEGFQVTDISKFPFDEQHCFVAFMAWGIPKQFIEFSSLKTQAIARPTRSPDSTGSKKTSGFNRANNTVGAIIMTP
jgi:hypothetical protein